MKDWTRFFAAMLTIASAALLFEQILRFGNPLGAAVGTAPLLLGLSAGAGAAAYARRGSLAAPQLAAQRRLTLSLVAAGLAGICSLAFGLFLFVCFAAYVAGAPVPLGTAAIFLIVSAAGKWGAITTGWKGIGLPFAKAATAVGAASLLLLALMILGGPLLTALALVAGGFTWSSAAKDAAPKDPPPVDGGGTSR